MDNKFFTLVEGNNADEIAASIKRAAHFSDKEVIDDPEEADVILVTTHSSALKMLKENEEAIIIIYLFPWDNEDAGARSLKATYPDRIVICQHFEHDLKPGDQLVVPYIISL